MRVMRYGEEKINRRSHHKNRIPQCGSMEMELVTQLKFVNKLGLSLLLVMFIESKYG